MAAFQFNHASSVQHGEKVQQYCDYINTLIESPKTERELHQRAIDAQEEYNQALFAERDSWRATADRSELTVSITKRLATLKRYAAECIKDLHDYQAKLNFIKGSVQNDQITANAFSWQEVKNFTEQVDRDEDKENTFNQAIEKLENAWRQQAVYVTHNLEDLFFLIDEFKDFRTYLQTREKTTVELCQPLVANLALHEEKINAAIKWRLLSGIAKKDLSCDDMAVALKDYIKKALCAQDFEYVNDSIDTLFHPAEEIPVSHNASFNLLRKAYKYLNKKKDIEWLQFYFKTYCTELGSAEEKQLGIQVIPNKLVPFIPTRPVYSFGGWLRQTYFRVRQAASSIWDSMKRWLFGEYNHCYQFLKETQRNVQGLKQKIQRISESNKKISLEKVTSMGAFRQALEIPYILQSEMLRSESVKPSRLTGVLLAWLPGLNRATSYRFMQNWQQESSGIEGNIKNNCQYIVKEIVKQFDDMIAMAINNIQTVVTPRMYNDLIRFMIIYGKSDQKLDIKKMIRPINILKKFKYIDPQTGKLKGDALSVITRFAKNYWQPDQLEAVMVICSIINREYLPVTTQEHEQTKERLQALKGGQKIEAFYQQTMQWIASLHASIGDEGGVQELAFMQQFKPNVAQTWVSRRGNVKNQAFSFIHALLSVAPNEEYDLQSDQYYGSDEHGCRFSRAAMLTQSLLQESNAASNYKAALEQKMIEYIDQYGGKKCHYAPLVLQILPEEHNKLMLWFEKRLNYLFIVNDVNQATVEDHLFYTQLCQNERYKAAFIETMQRHYHGGNDELADFILKCSSPEITGAYFAIRYVNLAKSLFSISDEDKSTFISLQSNPYFRTKLSEKICDLCKNTRNVQRHINDQFVEKCYPFVNEYTQDALILIRLEHCQRSLDLDDILSFTRMLGRLEVPLSRAVQTNTGTQKLQDIYASLVSRMQSQKRWDPKAQYITQFFDSEHKLDDNNHHTIGQQAAAKIRLLWLDNYLMRKGKVKTDDIEDNITNNLHRENKFLPNHEVGLAEIYVDGKAVLDILQHRFRSIDPNALDRMSFLHRLLPFIQEFEPDQAQFLAHQLSIFEKVNNITAQVLAGDYSHAQQLFTQYQNHLAAQRTLAASTGGRNSLIEHEELMLNMMKDYLLEHYKYTLTHFTTRGFTQQFEKSKAIAALLSKWYESAPTCLELSNEAALELKDQVKKVAKLITIDRLQHFNPSFSHAKHLREMADKAWRTKVVRQIQPLITKIQQDDPLKEALTAFITIINPKTKEGRFKKEQRKISYLKKQATEQSTNALAVVSQIAIKVAQNQEIHLESLGIPLRFLEDAFVQTSDSEKITLLSQQIIRKLKNLIEQDLSPASSLQTLCTLLCWSKKNTHISAADMLRPLLNALVAHRTFDVARFKAAIFNHEEQYLKSFFNQFACAKFIEDTALLEGFWRCFGQLEAELKRMINTDQPIDQINDLHKALQTGVRLLEEPQVNKRFQDLEYAILDVKLMGGEQRKSTLKRLSA